MGAVGGDDESACGDLVADLLCGEVGLTLGDAVHLGGDDAEAGGFELGDGGEAGGCGDAAGDAFGVGEDMGLMSAGG